ncbi:LpxI family protein [Thermovibrio sp.]
MQASKLALFAGSGELPLEFLRSARERGISVITFALKGITDRKVEELSDSVIWIKPFKLGAFLKELKRLSVEGIVFLGKVEHKSAFSLTGLDLKAVRFLLSLPNRKPETLIKGIFSEVESLGVRVLDPTPFLSHLLLPKGKVIGPKPDRKTKEDLEFGMKIARELATLDIGQTVVVKDKTVIAVEGVEGTDECIKRGALLADKGFVVCKGARRSQDMRIDVPTVGINTVKLIHSLGGKALAIDSNRTYLLNRREMEEFCRREGFSLLSY